MAQRVYATAADYYEFTGEDQPMVTPAPTDENPEPEPVPLTEKDLNALLRRASTRIDGYTRHSAYAVDEDKYPTDPDVSEAFKWATCAQTEWFLTTDDVTGADSQEGMVRIGTVQVGGGNAASAAAPRTPDEARTSAEALEILRNAGLITSAVAHT